jgi:hypothetical protein
VVRLFRFGIWDSRDGVDNYLSARGYLFAFFLAPLGGCILTRFAAASTVNKKVCSAQTAKSGRISANAIESPKGQDVGWRSASGAAIKPRCRFRPRREPTLSPSHSRFP